MKRTLIIAIFLLSALAIEAQTAVGQWTDCLPYNTAVCLAVGTDEVYASTGSSILIYNRRFDELKKLSRINGLSETGISSLGWSEEYKTLIIAYSSTNVDLMVNNTIYNIPDILRKYIEGGKTINRIRTNGKYAYLACSFGIVVVDLVKKEIYDTWKPGLNSDVNAINDIAFSDNKIFAATDNGVFTAGLEDQGLSYFGNWSRIEILPVPSGKYSAAIYSGNRLYVNLSDPSSGGDKVYSADFSSSLISFTPGIYNYSFDNSTTGFTVSSGGMLRYFNTAGQLTASVTSYSWGNPMIVMAVEENGITWIADSRSGLIRSGNRTDFTSLSLPGPASTNAFYISSLNGTTAITGGGTDQAWNNTGRQLEISINSNNEWNNIINSSLLDPVRVIIDPKDNNHVFVSTWGSGLLEYLNNSLVKQYNDSNSPLQSIVPGHPYVRIAGMAFDRSGKLWITQSGVQGSIKILKPDGTWITNPLTADAPVIGELIITLKGQVWIILPEGHGLFVFDDNNTPDITSDDRYRKIQVKDNDNQTISSVYSIAEDLDGNIWVGTDQGPLIYYSSVDVFNTDPKASRIKIPRNDGSDLADYLLKQMAWNFRLRGIFTLS